MPRKRSFLVAHRTLFLSMGFLVLFAASVSYAVPPISPYNAGDTLDPQCAPGTSNCKVEVSSPWTVAGGGGGVYTVANVLIGSATDNSSGQKLQVTGDAGVTGTLSAASFAGAGTGLTGTATALSIGGNAATATALQTARAINGVSFDGTSDITVTAAAGTLTGTTLNSTVVTSSLTSVGTLGSLTVMGNVTNSALTASRVVFSDGSKNLTSTGIGTSSQFVKADGSLDSTTYISGNQTITLSGDVSGSGTTAITTTIGAGKVTSAMLAGSITAAKLVGTDIAAVGTVTSGTWQGTAVADAYVASASAWNAKQDPIALTTAGTGGAATLVGSTLNIPQYAGATYAAGTGLTLTTGTFSVNASQSISTLSNLTSNGLIKTSGGTGALSVATAGADYLAPAGNGSALTGITWSQVGSTPTTLGGYGITDAYTKTASDARYEVPLTFSTGLTRTLNTITVDASQNITALSNLTSNGLVTTSGGAGTLGVTATTGSGNVVLATSPTITNPIITNLNPGADFTITQNSVAPFTSVNSGAVANTLVLNGGSVGIGTTTPQASLDVVNTSGGSLLSARNSSVTSTNLITTQTDRDFSGANNWTGTNWTTSGGTFVHTSGSAAPATLANANMTPGSIVSGRQYVVTLTVNRVSNTGLLAALGGTAVGSVSSTAPNGTYTLLVTAGADNADLTITPSISTMVGSFTNISVKPVITAFSVANNGSVYINSNANALLTNPASVAANSTSLLSVSRSSVGQGTISVTASSANILGVGTNFFNDFSIGDTITANGETHTITSVTSNSNMSTGTDVWTSTFSGAYTRPASTPLTVAGNGITTLTKLSINAAQSTGSWTTGGAQFNVASNVLTNSTAGASSTIATQVANSFQRPTFASTNTAVTVTTGATLYIANSPFAGTNTTITNPLSLYVAAGNSAFLGNVGIRTDTPTAALDIETDGAILARGTRGSGSTIPNLGSGERFMYYPSIGAIRAGYVSGTQWDAANVGQDSVAFGFNNLASGIGSIAIGDTVTSSGLDSVGFGTSSNATGNYSTVFGYSNTASGNVSTAFGQNNTAGPAGITTAFGYGNTAAGVYSTAFGYGNTASSYVSTALGQYNVGGGTVGSWVSTEPLFEIGNGLTSGTKADALVVLKNGNVGINLGTGVNNPAYNLVVGNSGVSGIVARFQNSNGTCDINPTSASLVCPSDMRLKKNVTLLSSGDAWSFNGNVTADNQSILAKVLALTPVTYNWKTESDNAIKHPGLIAQEVRQVFPDLVATDPQTGLLSMNYTGLIPYTVQAIQEMNVNVTDIANLDRPNTWREALIAWFANNTNGIGDFVANKFKAKNQICINNTCVNEAQLQQLLQQQGGGGGSAPSNPPSDQGGEEQTPEVVPPVVEDPIPDEPADGQGTPAPDETPDSVE